MNGQPAIGKTGQAFAHALKIIVVFAGSSGCLDILDDHVEPVRPVWVGDLEDLFSAKCASCHHLGGVQPSLSSYPDLVACGEDGERIATAGAMTGSLRRSLDASSHASFLDAGQRARVEQWLNEGLTFASPLAHPVGWASPGSSAFHGDALRAERYAPLLTSDKEARCDQCHGAEASGVILCESCHDGPFGDDQCGGCHGNARDPRPSATACSTPERRLAAGAHAMHRSESTEPAYPGVPCATCHDVPATVSTEAHIGGDTRAEVRLQNGTYDPLAQTCSVQPCHGRTTMSWVETSSSASCARCHGNPPANHASNRCERCHLGAFQVPSGPIAGMHLNGVVDVPERCDGCHGNPPPPGIPTVGSDPGAHTAHMTAGPFAGPMQCSACHLVPEKRDDPGHLDSDLPAEVTFARSPVQGESTWNGDDKTCSNVTCHGADLVGAQAIPAWTSGETIRCGACHGLPPEVVRGGAAHLPTGPASCGACHRTPSGDPITVGTSSVTEAGKAYHVDGCVDLGVGCVP